MHNCTRGCHQNEIEEDINDLSCANKIFSVEARFVAQCLWKPSFELQKKVAMFFAKILKPIGKIVQCLEVKTLFNS